MNEKLEKLKRARAILAQENLVCFTMDIDWASEYAIASALSMFREARLPVTVFVTHKSAEIDRTLAAGEIKCAIHPNFMPDSSQGGSYQEVVDFCYDLLPNARLFRAHRYYEVNDTMELLVQHGIVAESNLCTLLDVVPPFLHRSNTINFPIFWEDGAYLYHYNGFDYDSFWKQLNQPGLKVLNMHPMHLMLNTPYFSYTREIKDRLTREEWNALDERTIDQIAWKGEGITSFIHRIVSDVKASGIKSAYLEDVYDWIMEQE